jgi:hypothetical protein
MLEAAITDVRADALDFPVVSSATDEYSWHRQLCPLNGALER